MKPIYLLAGGRGSDRKKMATVIRTIFWESGKESPKVAYVGAATDDNTEFFNMMTASLKEAGAGQVSHALISPPHADLKKAKNILESADAVYISGGDVERGMQVLTEKKMVSFLQQLYSQGKLFFGMSAGSIMLAKEWVRWRDPDDDNTVEIFPCLGLAPVICDMHAEDDDWQELKTLLMIKQEDAPGYGLPSGTAIKVSPDGTVEALGGAVHQFIRHIGKVNRGPDILPAGNI
jgi:peptidase E